MPPFLNKRIIGLPAWAWMLVLAGGVTIGLILRQRQIAADEDENIESTDDLETGEVVEDYYEPDEFGDEYLYGAEYMGTDEYYPDQAGSINVSVNAGSSTVPCSEASKPTTKPRKGYQWVCRGGNWQLSPLKKGGGGKHHGGRNHGGRGGRHKQREALTPY